MSVVANFFFLCFLRRDLVLCGGGSAQGSILVKGRILLRGVVSEREGLQGGFKLVEFGDGGREEITRGFGRGCLGDERHQLCRHYHGKQAAHVLWRLRF